MGDGLAWSLLHSEVLMGAELAGRPACLQHNEVLMGAGLAERPPCLPHSRPLWMLG